MSSSSLITIMPKEIVYNFVEFSQSTGSSKLVNKEFNETAMFCFKQANREIAKIFPPLNKIFTVRKDTTSSCKLFMQLVNRLHDEAKILGCDEKAPNELTSSKRINWECENYNVLANKVAVKYKNTQLTRAKDFQVFVQLVAEAIGIKVDLQEITGNCDNSEEDSFLDPVVEKQDIHNHKVWDDLMKNPKINNLKEFKLVSSPALTFLPPEIGQLTQLEGFFVDRQMFKALPHEFEFLVNLKDFSSWSTLWKDFPIKCCKHTNLKKLTLMRYQLKKLPPEIGLLTNLEWLTLSCNELKDLPKEFATLTKLRHIYLNYNQFTKIPSVLLELDKLESIEIKKNKVTSIPSGTNKSIKI